MTARPVLYAVVRIRPGGRFTYTTPLWPDARGYLVGLLEQHAAAAIAAGAVEVARLARATAHQVPTAPPMAAWCVQVGECRYELARRHLGPAAATHWGSGSLSRRRRWRGRRLPWPAVPRASRTRPGGDRQRQWRY